MTKFNGTYSISINPRTNAIGMPIDYPRNVKLRNNILDLFDDSLLQNNKSIVSYDNDYWNIMNTQNGKIC